MKLEDLFPSSIPNRDELITKIFAELRKVEDEIPVVDEDNDDEIIFLHEIPARSSLSPVSTIVETNKRKNDDQVKFKK